MSSYYNLVITGTRGTTGPIPIPIPPTPPIPYCVNNCTNLIKYNKLVTTGNNPSITKAMKYSQYVKNRANKSNVINNVNK